MKIITANTLVSNQTINASGNTESKDKSSYTEAIFYIKVGTVGGSNTPTMTVQMQTSYDNVNWFDIESSVGITATGNNTVRSTNFGKYIRLKYTLTGTNPVFNNVDIILENKG